MKTTEVHAPKRRVGEPAKRAAEPVPLPSFVRVWCEEEGYALESDGCAVVVAQDERAENPQTAYTPAGTFLMLDHPASDHPLTLHHGLLCNDCFLAAGNRTGRAGDEGGCWPDHGGAGYSLALEAELANRYEAEAIISLMPGSFELVECNRLDACAWYVGKRATTGAETLEQMGEWMREDLEKLNAWWRGDTYTVTAYDERGVAFEDGYDVAYGDADAIYKGNYALTSALHGRPPVGAAALHAAPAVSERLPKRLESFAAKHAVEVTAVFVCEDDRNRPLARPYQCLFIYRDTADHDRYGWRWLEWRRRGNHFAWLAREQADGLTYRQAHSAVSEHVSTAAQHRRRSPQAASALRHVY